MTKQLGPQGQWMILKLHHWALTWETWAGDMLTQTLVFSRLALHNYTCLFDCPTALGFTAILAPTKCYVIKTWSCCFLVHTLSSSMFIINIE